MHKDNRVPAGVPTGGRFATRSTGEADIALADLPRPETATAPNLGALDRDARIEAMRSEIDAAMDGLSSEEGWATFLEAQSKFHKYSLGNTMLILAQRPDATMVAGFNDWKNKHHRSVNKGEKALWVMAPITRKVSEVDPASGAEREVSRMVGTRPVAVFDASQTDGEPLPANPSIPRSALDDDPPPPHMVEDMTSVIESEGFTIGYEPTGDAGGYTNFAAKRVVINSERNAREQARTLAHEAAHISLNHGDASRRYHNGPGGERPDMEVEAESVAYVIGRHYGLDNIDGASFNYIDGWARGDKERVKKTATNVVAGVRRMLDKTGRPS